MTQMATPRRARIIPPDGPPSEPIAQPEPETLWTIRDVAKYLKCGLSTVEKWRALGKLPDPVKLPGVTLRWEPETIRKWVRPSGR